MIRIPKSLDTVEFVKSATMFYIDEQLEKEFDERITVAVNEIKTRLLGITTIDGLKQYVVDDEDSLNKVISLLNISKERFKRIITMLRIQRRHRVTSEWDLGKIREQMISDSGLMSDVCELLMVGASSEKYKKLIPAFVLENFSIDVSTLGRLASTDDIRRLVKRRIEGDYNIKIGDSFFSQVQSAVTQICDKEGLTYSIRKEVPLLGRPVSIAIPSETAPRILVDITYSITTSSAQTDYARAAENAVGILRNRNEGKPEKKKTVFINVVDGAGWVARQSDLNKIERCSDYLLNLSTLDVFSDIINLYMLSSEEPALARVAEEPGPYKR